MTGYYVRFMFLRISVVQPEMIYSHSVLQIHLCITLHVKKGCARSIMLNV